MSFIHQIFIFCSRFQGQCEHLITRLSGSGPSLRCTPRARRRWAVWEVILSLSVCVCGVRSAKRPAQTSALLYLLYTGVTKPVAQCPPPPPPTATTHRIATSQHHLVYLSRITDEWR